MAQGQNDDESADKRARDGQGDRPSGGNRRGGGYQRNNDSRPNDRRGGNRFDGDNRGGGDRYRRDDRPVRGGRPNRDGRPSNRDGRPSDRRRDDSSDRGGDRPNRGYRPNRGDHPNRGSGDGRGNSFRRDGGGSGSQDRRRHDGERREGPRRDGDRQGGFRRDDRRDSRDGDRRHDRQGGFRGQRERDGDRKGGFRRNDRDGDRRHDQRNTRDSHGPDRRQRNDSNDDGRIDLRRSNRPDRPKSPDIDDDVTGNELDRAVRSQLRTLESKNAEWISKHLVMAGRYIDVDPALALEHALAASRRGGRIAAVREAVGVTAYEAGDFAEALRELRTFRRMSGSNELLPIMADCERGLGRPEKAIEMAETEDLSSLPTEVRVEFAMVLAGAFSDLGRHEEALKALQLPQLDMNRAYSYSPRLFLAVADVLEALGRDAEAQRWRTQSRVAEQALGVGDWAEPDILDLDDEDDDDARSRRRERRAEERGERDSGGEVDDSDESVESETPAAEAPSEGQSPIHEGGPSEVEDDSAEKPHRQDSASLTPESNTEDAASPVTEHTSEIARGGADKSETAQADQPTDEDVSEAEGEGAFGNPTVAAEPAEAEPTETGTAEEPNNTEGNSTS